MYRVKSSDDLTPVEWQAKEQVAVIDNAIGVAREWIKDARATALALQAAYSIADGNGDFAGAWPSDFNLYVADQSYFDNFGIHGEGFIRESFPAPDSEELAELEIDILASILEMVVQPFMNPRWHDIMDRWSSANRDPATCAYQAGSYILEAVVDAEISIFPRLLNMRQEWVDIVSELQDGLYQENIAGEIEDGGIGGAIQYMRRALSLSEDALLSLDEATTTRAADDIKFYTKQFKLMAANAADVPGLVAEDEAFMSRAADDLEDIAQRRYHNDIRAWESQRAQREDAKLAVDKVRSYWAKRLDATNDLGEIKRLKRITQKAQARKGDGTIPAYRFNVGSMVKVRTSRRYGKVLGAKLEGGTGKQVYEVRVNGVDHPKNYYAHELERAD